MTKLDYPEELLEYFRKQGRRGGKQRAENLSSADRKRIAKKAAQARWAEKKAADGTAPTVTRQPDGKRGKARNRFRLS